ncbi:Cdc42-binding protein kinase beta [Capsaspora owczarzaki ATCC 30864]|uniref:non-specific serine/threonine protein kinase n=1 Tax=Capsaspora owczarzaki (strain ATCC 30864) TaxID=595528 RepID=A0A0D2U0G6_CAPO3|nr:Cdc42-binding protein kinase beta [Capsaspora owczarzaki ATCC 30864]KJE88721.1 AGC/DMPK/ROCK protein kinase [Capsaspora owczarzaki ATCC 30864]|eukprot:XP_004365187.2 Cdc42-binding protein kinase beta [Capsaspora owczarzaki ATCC 30864]
MALSDRFAALCGRLTDMGSTVSIDALLDAIQVLYDECNTAGIKRTTNVPEFLAKYNKPLNEVTGLRPNRADFETVKIIGRGAFGEVHLVKDKHSGNTYAMKCLSKFEMLKRSDTAFYWQERDVMAASNTPWIISLHYAFQDEKYLYLVMDFVPGGDLVTILSKYDFTEDMTRFYMAETVLAVDALHQLGYIHRDIKPDNMLLDASGHVKLADFGTCIKVGKDGLVRSDSAIGTPDYISPEVLESQNGAGVYGGECDWWSVGIMLFELLYGETPFYSESLLGTYGQIMNHQKHLKFPSEPAVSADAIDLMKKLICSRDVRLGKTSIADIKSHPFFKGISWDTLRDQKPPVVPEVKSNVDTSNFEDIDEEHTHNEHFPAPKTFSGNHLPFVGYTFARSNRFKVVGADGTEIARPAAPIAIAAPASASGGGAEDELVAQIEALEREKARFKSEFDSLQKKFDLEIEARKLAETELKANSRKTDRSAREQESAMRLMKELEKTNQDLEKTVAVSKLEVKEANRLVEEATKSKKRLQSELEQLRENAGDLSREREYKKQLDEAKKQLSEARETMADELDELKSQFTRASDQNKTLQSAKTDLEKELAIAQIELKEATAKLSTASSNSADGDKRAEEAEKALAALRSQVASLTDSVKSLTDKASASSAELETAKASLATQQRERQSLQEELAAVEKAKAMAIVDQRNAEDKLKRAEEELESLRVAHRKKLDRSDSEIAESQAHVKEVEALKSEVARIQSLYDQQRNAVSELERKLSISALDLKEAERQHEKAVKAHKEAEAEIETLKAKVDAKHTEAVDAREKLRELESSKAISTERVTSLTSQLEQERATHRELQTLYNSLAKSNVTTQIEVKEVSRKLAAAEAANQGSDAKLADLTAKLEEKTRRVTQVEALVSEAELARDGFKAKFEDSKSKLDGDVEALAELQSKFAEAEKNLSLLQIEVKGETTRANNAEKSLADAQASAAASVAELQEQVAQQTTVKESLEAERARLDALVNEAKNQEHLLQEEVAAGKKRLVEEKRAKEQIIIQSTQKESALNLALEKLSKMPASGKSDSKAPDSRYAEKKQTRSTEFRNLEKLLQEERQLTTKLKMQTDTKEFEIQELRHQLDELTAQFEQFNEQLANSALGDNMSVASLSLPEPGDTRMSMRASSVSLSAGSRRKSFDGRSLEGWLKTPKDPKNLKKGGWIKRYVVVSSYDEEKGKGSEPLSIIDLSDVILVRKVTQADVIHASQSEVDCIFQMLYKKQGELTAASSKPVFSDPNEKFHPSRGHEFVSTHFSKPTWCLLCKGFIYGIGKQGYCCRKCNYVSHRKCYTDVAPCMSDVEATQLLFMGSSVQDRDRWISGCSASKTTPSLSPTGSRKSIAPSAAQLAAVDAAVAGASTLAVPR